VIHKPFEQIRREDIDALVANEVKESRTLEYKEKLPGNAEKDKKEFLADVSAFANAAGGDLLYGVVEKRDSENKTTGLPESVPGLAGVNTDQEGRRLESMLQAGLAPRIPGVRLASVEGFAEGPVLLLRIPKSYAAPHMVTFQEHSRFYSRNNNGKYALDVAQIRSAFALSESLPERVRRFRDERLARIVADETPFTLPPDRVRFVLHVIPVAALDPTFRVDTSLLAHCVGQLPPLGAIRGWDGRHNLDGFVTYSAVSQVSAAASYTQLFRTGAIEAVEGNVVPSLTADRSPLDFGYCEQWLIKGLGQYLAFLNEQGLRPPIFVLLSILGVKGYALGTRRNDWRNPHRIDRDALLLPDVLVDDYRVPAETILRPVFDAVWQSAGWPRCPNYTPEGKWQERS
jgi:hypothetical protein